MMNSNLKLVKTLLTYTFGLVPIVAGLDKFTNLLTDWSQYLPTPLAELIPFETSTFMMIVGVIEIVAGVLVLVKTNIGSLVVSLWLVLIAILLIMNGQFDVAVRDVVMAISAYSLFLISKE